MLIEGQTFLAAAIVMHVFIAAGRLSLFAVFACGMAWTSVELVSAETPPSTDQDQRGFAVVELFTSQGCSSCPPADRVLRNIHTIATQRNLPVYVLSFHVDYWNRLGWKDPYSDPVWSKRQREYAESLRSDRVYTPQLVVNGIDAFVGSNGRKAIAAINRGLAASPDVRLSADIDLPVESDETSPITVMVKLNFEGDSEPLDIHAAVVSTPAANEVPRGENAGSTLAHVHVVRSLTTNSLSSGEHSMAVKVDAADLGKARLILFAQHPRTFQIVAATSLALPNGEATSAIAAQ